MRQTSRAVALLLAVESANAAFTLNFPAPTAGVAYDANVFNPTISEQGNPSNSNQLNGRTAGYVNKVTTFNAQAGATWTALVTNKAVLPGTGGTNALSITVAGASGCMACLNKAGVWCSSTYSYLSTSATFQQDAITAGTNSTFAPGVGVTVTGAANDNGSCCETDALFNTFIFTQTQRNTSVAHTVHDNTTSQAGAGLAMVAPACVAITNTVSGTDAAGNFGVSEIEATTVAYSGWWCSNGLYKTVQSNGNITLNAQQVIPQATNKRKELAQVGCPQAKVMCGDGSTIAVELTTGASATRTVGLPATGMTTNNKCTWVTFSKIAAPTFKFADSIASSTAPAITATGITGTNWEIHAMEYTSGAATTFDNSNGSLVQGLNTAGFDTGNEALAAGNMTPLFTMPAAQYATLRTWYGEGGTGNDSVSGQVTAWLSVGQVPIANSGTVSLQLAGVKSQLYGNVANVPVSNNIQQATSNDVIGDFNFGKYNGTAFDLRALRYFPAKVAQANHAAGTNAAATYTSALSSYNTAKTTWDAYVAILEKNAKQDAFAALFSPPKAPTVPPLPNMPWLPAAYSGYTRATADQIINWNNNNTVQSAAASPTASQFWTNLSAAQTVGGWGSFTATILRFRNGWGKSFGTIGYDGSTTAMGDVWNYKWTCIAADALVSTTSQCAPTYTSTTAGLTAVGTSNSAVNAINMIVAVSLWSTANTAVVGGNVVSATVTAQGWANSVNGFSIVFTSGAWASGIVGLTPIAAPTAATAAKSLTGIAGAQALVASSAAALAVAAALY